MWFNAAVCEAMPRKSTAQGRRRIWIDLDNSPHVPFFVPIVEELEKRGHSIVLTARNCAQVYELVDLYGLECKRVGRHYGKVTIVKLAGLFLRALQLISTVRTGQLDLAVSHGSRSQLIVSTVMGIPSLSIGDYEFSKGYAFIRPTWLMCPEVIPEATINCDRKRILKYPGIKEDVYVPRFRPDPNIQLRLGLSAEDLLITLRPPADDAHYHNPQSDELFVAVMGFLSRKPHTKIVLLPRREKQAAFARKTWPDLFARKQLIIPEHVVDGLNLIWHSDLVISGGGTMNREAAALGVPVYSIFRGKIGAVDRYLAEQGRLTLIENIEEIQAKLVLRRRSRRPTLGSGNRPALHTIVNCIEKILATGGPAGEVSPP
jgi:predicted glycosyltransferase